MKYVGPEFSRQDVNLAGRFLIGIPSENEREWSLQVINNWRAAHGFPLVSFNMTLRGRALKIGANAVIAQRLKRLPSIETKLRRFPKMKLSQMQDIGGCRAVLRTVRDVDALVKLYLESTARNPKTRHEFLTIDDYIRNPKRDGYRSVHLVYRYRTSSLTHTRFNDLKVEIQVRSRLQHAWATAVETVSTFTGQALKQSVGELPWRRFFELMGSAIAAREKQPLGKDAPNSWSDLVNELRYLAHSLNVEAVLSTWGNALRRLPTRNATNAAAFLLFLDPIARTIEVTGYARGQLAVASEHYLALEQQIASSPQAQAVLVSVESVDALKKAYPNYFLDTRTFLSALAKVLADDQLSLF